MSEVMTCRDFNRDVGNARRAADEGPVVIGYRGMPANIMIKHGDEKRLPGKGPRSVGVLAYPAIADNEFGPQRLKGPLRGLWISIGRPGRHECPFGTASPRTCRA